MANQFDFQAYNNLTNGIPAGLKIVLAKTLLEDAIRTCERFDNPLAPDLMKIGNDLRTFNLKWKEASKARAAEMEKKQPQPTPNPVVTQRSPVTA